MVADYFTPRSGGGQPPPERLGYLFFLPVFLFGLFLTMNSRGSAISPAIAVAAAVAGDAK